MKLVRPYIPIDVRLKVAERQLGHSWSINGQGRKERLRLMLKLLFANEPFQLDHDPALTNRPYNKKTRRYTPDANDPDYLVYRSTAGHEIKTRVRGDGAQHSDLGLRRKMKRIERRETRPIKKIPSRPFQTRQK